MKQVRTVLPTYSADVFGVCSALYELGGMLIMHDASGCNSTYTTHDEPRWYDSDAMVFISALTQTDAVLGNDGKLVNDILSAVQGLNPKFVALAGTPIPVMTGFDFGAVAAEIESAAGIPCFGFPTDGMHSYIYGVSDALACYAERMVDRNPVKVKGAVNIIGATPLDFGHGEAIEKAEKELTERGFSVVGKWAMNSSPDELRRAGEASVNLVVSETGLKTAMLFEEIFDTPYVVGFPEGEHMLRRVTEMLEASEKDGKNRSALFTPGEMSDKCVLIAGEPVMSASRAEEIMLENGKRPVVVNTVGNVREIGEMLCGACITALEEEEIIKVCAGASRVVADPLFASVIPKNCTLVEVPHVALSGRMFI